MSITLGAGLTCKLGLKIRLIVSFRSGPKLNLFESLFCLVPVGIEVFETEFCLYSLRHTVAVETKFNGLFEA